MPAVALTAPRKAPSDTLRDVAEYLKEAGVTRLCDLTGMDRIGIPVYASVRPDSQSLAVDSGKGFEPEQAKCSAAMESLERWVCDEAEPDKVIGTYDECFTATCITDFPLTKGAHFNGSYRHSWTLAKQWTGGDEVYVPYWCVKIYKGKIPIYQQCWQSGTNGLAAGNTVEEAICSGLYEVIERDAVSIFMYDKHPKKVDLDSIHHADCQEMLDMCENAGVGVHIFDATSDIGIPVFTCIMVDRQLNVGMYKGFGAHLDSHIALRRSICEAAQSRAVFISGARDDMTITRQRTLQQTDASKNWDALLASGEIHQYIESGTDMEDDAAIRFVEQALVNKGCGRVLVVTLMDRPNLAVVRVLVSGLEGYWQHHLEPGRRILQ